MCQHQHLAWKPYISHAQTVSTSYLALKLGVHLSPPQMCKLESKLGALNLAHLT